MSGWQRLFVSFVFILVIRSVFCFLCVLRAFVVNSFYAIDPAR
jgi:hypothetical protein